MEVKSKRLAKKILLVGWGSADWKIIDPLIEGGKLPTIKKLVESGIKASIGGFDPPLFSTSWNNIFTGKTPNEHNIVSFTQNQEEEIIPILRQQRKVKTIWTILSENNFKVNQIGAWASHPAEKINGVSVSDLFPYFNQNNIPKDSVHPNELTEKFANFIVDKNEISDEELTKFISPKYLKDNQFGDQIENIKEFVSETKTLHNSAKEVLSNKDWDFTSITYPQLSKLSMQFMAYHIDSQNHDKEENEALKNVLICGYQHLDNLLKELLDMAGEEVSLFLVSQCGFPPDKLWLERIKKKQSTWEYNSDGIMLFKGNSSKNKHELFALTQLDIAPTILAMFGLPLSKDLKGNIFVAKRFLKNKLDIIESYEATIENDKIEKESFKAETLSPGILEKQLKDLGYLSNNQDDYKELREYYRARIQVQTGLVDEAAKSFEKLWKKYPKSSWYGGRLAGCYLLQNKPVEAKELIDKVLDISDEVLDLQLVKANILMSEMKFRSASKIFEKVGENTGMQKGIYSQIADAYLRMNQPNLAIKYFKKENQINPNPVGFLTLGMIQTQNKRIKPAIESFKRSLELAPNHPMTLFQLGSSLNNSGQYEEAADVLEKAKIQNRDPKTAKKITQMLVSIYKNQLEKPEKIVEMQKAYEDSIGSRGTITVVSGLPRSGTSMMMQMLDRGGLKIFTDGLRGADENNKKGYYEHEAVKNMIKNKQFLSTVGDKVVKIISHLLFHLPHIFKYKIVFMDRDIEEVMHSQHKMLGRLDKNRGKNIENSLALLKTFEDSRKKAIDWCKKNEKYVEYILVPYKDAVSNPKKYAKLVNEFLGGSLDVQAMASIADKSLYREKSDKIKA